MGAELGLAFEVSNPGDAPLKFEVALHTYLAVADLDRIAIEGLGGCAFVDKVAGGARRREGTHRSASRARSIACTTAPAR